MPRAAATALGSLASAAAVLMAAIGVCGAASRTPPADAPTFVGSAACGGCHQSETAAWRGSQHALAMQTATAATVLGNFDDASFTHAGLTSRFFKRDGGFFVATEGPDGKPGEFQIRYTFGVYPLQQYLIAFPDGRIQALGIAWDARPKDQGGQRWFHLYPDQTLHAGNPLHWTGIDQTWNFMCAECHTTELHKNYDAASNTYATTWAEIDVGCETCHGPGAAHVAWAGRQPGSPAAGKGGDDGLVVRFDERQGIHWTIDPATGNAVRSAPRTSAKELETCGVCHARSAKIAEGWRPGQQLLQTHLPSLLEPGLFEADGKMLDEVYNYASFRQSKMFMHGVSCSDCHEPHALELRAEGNGVCYQCHEQAKYGAVSHHHHADGSPAAGCPACHMPERTYMVVDPRHDHGFRIPRPDLSARFGVSNACNDCHADKDAAWAAAAVERWYGPERKGLQTWTEAFAAARDDKVEAGPAAAAGRDHAGGAGDRARDRARGPGRTGRAPRRSTPPGRASRMSTRWFGWRRCAPCDPCRSSRAGPWRAVCSTIRSAGCGSRRHRCSRPCRRRRLAPADRQRLARAIDDYVADQRLNADRPEGRVNLGNLYAQQGQPAAAEAEYMAARALDPTFVAADVSLAQLYARQRRDAEGERILRAALARMPADAELHSALGLNLVRQGRGAEALPEIARAAELDPANARYAYVQGIALNSTGRTDEALKVLEASHARHPADRDTLLALVTINRDAGHLDSALTWADRLAAIDPEGRALRDQIARLAGAQQ